jgi:hypothetical protein
LSCGGLMLSCGGLMLAAAPGGRRLAMLAAAWCVVDRVAAWPVCAFSVCRVCLCLLLLGPC